MPSGFRSGVCHIRCVRKGPGAKATRPPQNELNIAYSLVKAPAMGLTGLRGLGCIRPPSPKSSNNCLKCNMKLYGVFRDWVIIKLKRIK